MARVTLSLDDQIAAQLDAFAEEKSFNRSQAAEHILRAFFATTNHQVEAQGAQTSVDEIKDYITLLHSTLVATSKNSKLPAPPWVEVPSFLGRRRTLHGSSGA